MKGMDNVRNLHKVYTLSPKFADPEKLPPAPAEVYRFLFPHHFRYHQTTANKQRHSFTGYIT
jgi:hypothetical protein